MSEFEADPRRAELGLGDVSLVHVKKAAGTSMCVNAYPGELLVRSSAEVTCPDCREWAHA